LTAIAVADDGLRVLPALPADYDPNYLRDNQIAELSALLLPRLLIALHDIRKDLRVRIRLNNGDRIVSQRHRGS
jgi:hypothetical protein